MITIFKKGENPAIKAPIHYSGKMDGMMCLMCIMCCGMPKMKHGRFLLLFGIYSGA